VSDEETVQVQFRAHSNNLNKSTLDGTMVSNKLGATLNEQSLRKMGAKNKAKKV